MRVSPPSTEAELAERARDVAGLSLADLADRHGEKPPVGLRVAKGWAGQLLETALGASASTLPEPDFQLIGVELKTIPVSAHGTPRETTYVCTVPLGLEREITWERSVVWHKLRRVLWVPIQAEPSIPVAERRVGNALLWSPSPSQAAALRADWEELMDMVVLGEIERIIASHGTHLQIRPKATDSRASRWSTGAEGDAILTLPRGFYLRQSFTAEILRSHYALV